MKKFMKATAAITLTMAMFFAFGCKPEDEPTNQGGNNDGGGNGGNTETHTYVDLGLPSGTLWATCNVGAEKPEDYGDYLAWGETTTKTVYDGSTYKYYKIDYNGDALLTKYNNDPEEGYNGFVDYLLVLSAEDDAATANWGNNWRMPTENDYEELRENTISAWENRNGVNGRVFTAENGNSIFLPAAGAYGSDFHGSGEVGLYWSSQLDIEYPIVARALYMNSECCEMEEGDAARCYGLSVRPVRSAR